MIFLYSRKSQLLLLLLWLIGMGAVYFQTVSERPLWLAKASERIIEQRQKALLGKEPVLPVQEKPAPPVQEKPARPAPDPKLNRCLELRVDQGVGEHADTLTVELDYVPALNKGFTIADVRSYYLEDSPVYVVALGEPWVSSIGAPSIPGTMPQVTSLNMIVSRSRNLRLLVHTRTMREARGATLHLLPTETGIRTEIKFPR